MAWLLYDVQNPLFRALVIRKNSEDLKDWIDRAQRMYSGTGAKFVGKPAEIHFPSGAKIVTGHLKDDNAFMKYQGHEYHRILLEELTHIPSEESYLKLISSCRSTVPGLKPRIFATTNPGGSGHSWVKKRFVDPSRAMTAFEDPQSGRARIYIPATVDDNPTLIEADPEYIHFLESLPPDLKAQWRFGSWDNQKIKGAYYADDIIQAQNELRITRLPLQPHHDIHTFWDLGINDTQVCWFAQVVGQEINVVDLHADNGKPFQFYVQMLLDKGYKYGKTFLPHDGVKRGADTLRSFKDVLVEAGFEVEVVQRTKDKLADIEKSRIIFPRCRFDSENCQEGINALTQYRKAWDEERQVFSDYPYHDWTSNFADAFQCMAISVGKMFSPGSKKKTTPEGYKAAAERFMLSVR